MPELCPFCRVIHTNADACPARSVAWEDMDLEPIRDAPRPPPAAEDDPLPLDDDYLTEGACYRGE